MVSEGAVLGQYQIIKRLGAGGMATVYLAYHTRLDRHVAVKVMHDAFLQDDDFLTRFEREAQIIAQLEHPHIVPIYDYSEVEGKPYLVMKFIEGHSLKSILDESNLSSVSEVLRILEPIGAALDYAHQQGILHRDVKPSNIILDEEDIPYLADFGLARIAVAGESTMSRDAVLGTPQYISPEQAAGKREIDGRADLYSLGIILYQMLVGDVPFSADTPYAIIHDHIYRPIPEPDIVNPYVSPGVSSVLIKALRKTPENRYSSARELLASLKQAATEDQFEILNPVHARAAAISIAEQREALDQNTATPVITPRLTAQTNTILDSASLVTEYRYPRSWLWRVGGIIGFLISMFGIGAVSASIDTQVFARRVNMLSDQIEMQQQEILDNLPAISEEGISSAMNRTPEDGDVYLSVARVLWSKERDSAARQVLERGQRAVTTPIEFTLTAANLALVSDQPESAARLYIDALNQSQMLRQEQYAVVRNISGERLYEISQQYNQKIIESDLMNTDVTSTDTDGALYLLLIPTWIYAQELDMVEQALQNADRQDSFYEAELLLFEGNYYKAIGDIEEATDRWNNVLELEYAPQWVIDVVEGHLERASQNE